MDQLNLTHQDALPDFNSHYIIQNAQLIDNSFMHGDLNQLNFTAHSSMVGSLNQIDLAHHLSNFNAPGINQNTFNQFTDGYLNQDLTQADDFSWCRYISEPNTEYI